MNSKELCLSLIHADTAKEVKNILLKENLWNDESLWRPFGDVMNNFGSIGNQQSDSVAALVEKIINSIDARLMSFANERGLKPSDADCPRDMREAIAQFIDNRKPPYGDRDGRIYYWDDVKIREESTKISLFATGKRASEGYPCLTISDTGEGQTPDRFPETFMSLAKSNKMDIPFVQGKFNMGGTGVFPFCKGEDNDQIQLVVSRRNPVLVKNSSNQRDHEWGFSVIRKVTRDGMRSSMYEYLAPLNRQVFSFTSEDLPIFPSDDKDRPRAYAKAVPYGSLVKLFEYECKFAKTNLTFAGSKGDSLKLKIEEALTESALPVQIAECRPHFKEGRDRRSFVDEILGSITQLGNMDQDKRITRLETPDPINGSVTVNGTPLPVTVYVFKANEDSQKYNSKGIYFTINGQTHGIRPATFFTRKKINLGYIRDSIFAVVNCTHMTPEMREELFMNSRDRMRTNALSQELEDQLESFLGEEQTLQLLNRKRREEQIKKSLEDQKPLEDTLRQLLKVNPKLAELLPFGVKLPTNAFGLGAGTSGTSSFEGKKHPSFFRFKKNRETLERKHPINQGIRVDFETDVLNNYFSRKTLPGEMSVDVTNSSGVQSQLIFRIGNLFDGLMNVVLNLDQKHVQVGDEITYTFTIKDETLSNPFINHLRIVVEPPSQPSIPGTDGANTTGTTPKGKSGAVQSAGLPNIIPVDKESWGDEWDEKEALHVKASTESGYDFFYNKDNKDLINSQAIGKVDSKVLDSQYKIGLMLIALSLIEASKAPVNDENTQIIHSEVDVEALVAEVTKGISPFWLDIVQGLAGMRPEESFVYEE